MRFSPSKNTCYPENIAYSKDDLPSDLVSFSDDIFKQFCMTAGASLKVSSGNVVIVPPPEPVEE